MEVSNKKRKQTKYLEKAERFQVLKNIYQFQSLLKVDPFRLNYHLNKPIYFSFKVPKKKGGFRIIQSPNEELKEIQRKLNFYLQSLYLSYKPKSVHGFVFNPNGIEAAHTIVSNARPHCNKKHVLNMDMEDFFPSISAKRIKDSLSQEPFNLKDEVSTITALIGSFEKKLPTGAPTSPVLSNIVCYKLDLNIEEYCFNKNIKYTRYADDLSFSSDNVFTNKIINELKKIITDYGFALNDKKFRLLSSKSKQVVTGLVVNQKPNVDRKYIRRLRAILYSWETMGVELAAAKHYQLTDLNSVDVSKFVRKLIGQIEFVGQVRGNSDSIYKKFKDQLKANLDLDA